MHFVIKFTQTTNYQNSPFIGKPTDRIPRDNPKNIPIFTTVEASKASIEEANSKLYYNRLFFNFLRIVAEPRKQKTKKKQKEKENLHPSFPRGKSNEKGPSTSREEPVEWSRKRKHSTREYFVN